MLAIKFRVAGRVQGVGFRYSTRNAAEDLGLAGWVRNRPDGEVEGVVEGAAGSVHQFVDWLWQGPRHARVSNVVTSECSSPGSATFEIIR